jgi:hypothetical protein
LFRTSCHKCWFRRMSTKTKTNLHGLWPTCCLNTLFFSTIAFSLTLTTQNCDLLGLLSL